MPHTKQYLAQNIHRTPLSSYDFCSSLVCVTRYTVAGLPREQALSYRPTHGEYIDDPQQNTENEKQNYRIREYKLYRMLAYHSTRYLRHTDKKLCVSFAHYSAAQQ